MKVSGVFYFNMLNQVMEKTKRNKQTNKFKELGKKKGSRADFIKVYKEMKKEKDKDKKPNDDKDTEKNQEF